ncbi:MAG: GNAT family N-acetyltransferase [Flavobacterium sp.]|nr:GNAT family N-acetyltransferase [Flavobacterium sp.]MBP6099806.1 GNAT family N-acetyltransferase [Flavobacterium sp.]
MKLVRTTSDNLDFQQLVVALDAYLRIVDGDDHAFYAQFNKTDSLSNVLVCYDQEVAIGCGAFKAYDSQTVEIKRMYTLPEYRGIGVAKNIMAALEEWAKEEKYSVSILETGYLQKDAIALYTKIGYEVMENFGQYEGISTSVCMQKTI